MQPDAYMGRLSTVCKYSVFEVYPGNNAALEIPDLRKLSLVNQRLSILTTSDPDGAADA